MTIQLFPMMAPINRKELANHNSNLERITTGLTHLQYQINVLAGGEDVELLLQRIEQATNNAVNATTLTNEATMAAVEATNQASQATTQTIEATDKAEQTTILANEMLQAMATQMDEAEEAIQAALQATTEAIEAKQKAEVATMASEQATNKTIEATEQAIIITTQAEQATNQAISAAEQAIEIVDKATQILTKIDGMMTQFQFVGTYDNTITYQPYNAVLYQGSTFLALQITTNQPPPTLPVTANEHWQLVAQRGIDGKGAVTTVNGISPNTDGDVTLPMPKVDGGLNYFATGTTRSFTTLNLDIELGSMDELTQLTIQVNKNAWVSGSISRIKFIDGTEKEIRRIGESTPVALKREDYPENMDVILQTFRYDGTTFFVAAPKATGAKVPTVKIKNKSSMLSQRVGVGDVLTYVDKVPIDGNIYSHNYAPSTGITYTEFISLRMFDYDNDVYGNLVFHGVKSYNRWTFYWYSNKGNYEIMSYKAEKVLLAYQTSENTALIVLRVDDGLEIYNFMCDVEGKPSGISNAHINLFNNINDDDIIIDYNRQTSNRHGLKYLYLNIGNEGDISIIEINEGNKDIRYYGDASIRDYSKAVATSDGLIYQDANNKSLYIVENNGGNGKLSLAIDGMPLESLGLKLLSSDGNDNIIVNVSASNAKGLLPYWLIDRTKQNSTELNLSNITSFDLPNADAIDDIALVSKQNTDISDVFLLVRYQNEGIQYYGLYLKEYPSYNIKRNNEKTTLAIPVVMNFNIASSWGIKTGNQPMVSYVGKNQSGKYELTKTYEAEYSYWHEINNVSLIDGLSLMPFVNMPYIVSTTPKAFTLINHKNNDYEGVLGKNLYDLFT